MWDFNYDNPDKLHMSIGLSLIIAAFILFLLSTLYYFDRLDSVSENYYDTLIHSNGENTNAKFIEEYKLTVDDKINAMIRVYKPLKWISLVMLIVGLILFVKGYLPYKKTFHTKKE